MDSVSAASYKKRKQPDTATQSYTELEAELLEKNKELQEKITELEQVIEMLKSNLESTQVDDDDISDTAMEELDTSDPWNSKFLQLREYRIINSHCNVPCTRGHKLELLGQWVNNQKRAFGNVKTGKKGPKISPERIAMLDGLGFNWGKKFPSPASWDKSFEELQKYKKAMGHCNIHIDTKIPSPLAKWVSAQRLEYKRMRIGRDSLLSMEQIERLNSVGFKWKGPRSA